MKVITIEVLLSCYYKDNPLFFKFAIESTYDSQTVKPDRFLIVFDGPVSEEIEQIANSYKSRYPEIFFILRLKENKGLGNALKQGVLSCSCDYILRMDADDISSPERIETLKRYIQKHKEIDVLGSYTAEFENEPHDYKTVRVLKRKHSEIKNDAKKRSPISHVSALIKRETLLRCGNYKDFPFYEDYYLWVRMITGGAVFENLPEILVYVRTDCARYRRKANPIYVESSLKFQQFLYNIKYINKFEFIRNILIRYFVAVVPVTVRKLIYENILRTRRR